MVAAVDVMVAAIDDIPANNFQVVFWVRFTKKRNMQME